MVNDYELISRLISCGFTRTNAEEICRFYESADKHEALENYVDVAESVLKGARR